MASFKFLPIFLIVMLAFYEASARPNALMGFDSIISAPLNMAKGVMDGGMDCAQKAFQGVMNPKFFSVPLEALGSMTQFFGNLVPGSSGFFSPSGVGDSSGLPSVLFQKLLRGGSGQSNGLLGGSLFGGLLGGNKGSGSQGANGVQTAASTASNVADTSFKIVPSNGAPSAASSGSSTSASATASSSSSSSSSSASQSTSEASSSTKTDEKSSKSTDCTK